MIFIVFKLAVIVYLLMINLKSKDVFEVKFSEFFNSLPYFFDEFFDIFLRV